MFTCMADEDINQAIGKAIRKARREREWSQEHLAHLANSASGYHLHLHATTVTRIENGKRKITAEEAIYLASALEMATVDLLGTLPEA